LVYRFGYAVGDGMGVAHGGTDLRVTESMGYVNDVARLLSQLFAVEAMELLLEKLGKTKSNADFLAQMQNLE
jgi:transcription termination factor Rho